ncbi:methyltransferase FkbM family [Arcticibacter svalbardensis MN12-7]|uniref:Methyltransferase FkbM family n=1 Tax=Arcticibacter svalbardensis MN12-7 TaxID=1150600 RepID=R9GQ63_9SPHI|nr:FkbM family methyltransferase [Arcticibacter svalbardensis]EOR93982.1 methyltransferase FkbM family [Arcticibacter svalbardensis MN12-7]
MYSNKPSDQGEVNRIPVVEVLSKEDIIRDELERLSLLPRFEVGYTHVIFHKPFKFHDGLSFVATYKELFETGIYKFNPSETARTILDCGANMGLSVLYFALNYKEHQIIAFEPEEHIFNILQENVETFKLENVKLFKKAVWDKVGNLSFYTDGGMGGRVLNAYANQQPKSIEAVPLKDFLTDDVDLLKIDIEGAEDLVLRSCKGLLKQANHIFFEYHNHIGSKQTLHELLLLMQDEGFHYYIKESAVLNSPFTDKILICEAFDMAINVFCYKEIRKKL